LGAVLLQLAAGGLAIGIIYGLIALGFTMIIRALDLVNFAQGQMMMLGAMVGFTLVTTGRMPYAVAFVGAVAATALLGYLADRAVFRPMRQRGAPMINLLIATIGLSIFLQNIAIPIWGSQPLRYPPVFGARPLQIGGVAIPSYVVPSLIVGVAASLALMVFFTRTRTGLAMRAAAQDMATARLMGVDIDRMVSYTFAISAALGGAAGVLLAPVIFASFSMGEIGVKAFVAAAIGGLGNVPGAILGGLILGWIETYSAAFISSSNKDAITYGILIVLLLFLPQGLLGSKRGRPDR